MNIDVEINLISREFIDDANCVMKKEPKLELVFCMVYSRSFFGLYEDVKVAIKEFKTRHPTFIIEVGDHDLVLRPPFLNSVKFNPEY